MKAAVLILVAACAKPRLHRRKRAGRCPTLSKRIRPSIRRQIQILLRRVKNQWRYTKLRSCCSPCIETILMRHRVLVNDCQTKSHGSLNYWQLEDALQASSLMCLLQFNCVYRGTLFRARGTVLYLSTLWALKQIVTKLQAKEEIYQQPHGFQQI